MTRLVLTFIALLFALPATAIDLAQDKLDQVFAASFEVVIAKPTKDPVVYERKLPLELLSYQYRNDKYYSVGSAFRIEDGTFVSASHVLNLGFASLNKEIGLRDSAGNVYPIDNIIKYSSNRDFVVFSVKGIKPGAGLAVDTHYKLNSKVYTVGNALGEGVVIRDGLYTSDTPEEMAGEWKWMRFSAAASPGNSGGPLLDAEGKVVGVILRKSESENLNYALPIKEVIDFGKEAQLKEHAIYKLDITDDSYDFKTDRTHKLPMAYQEIDKLLQKDYQEANEAAAQAFMKKYHDRLFPYDSGSLPILYNSFTKFFPSIVSKGSDGIWDIVTPKDIQGADTGNGGRINFGKMGNFYYMNLKRPDNVDMDTYYSDSKIFLDQILKGLGYVREVGPENIRVVSMGKAAEEHIHTDAYGRKWQVRSWFIGFSDQKFVFYALPTPDGYAAMLSVTDTSDADMMEIDMKIFVDYLYITYYGTLEEWNHFFARKDLIPATFKDITFQTDYKNYIKYEDKHFIFKVGPENIRLSKNSDFQLRCSYYKEGNKVAWGPASIAIGEDKNTSDFASVGIIYKPPVGLGEQYRQRWDSMIAERTPYDAKAYINEKMTGIAKVISDGKTPLADNNSLYTMTWNQQGSVKSETMEKKLEGMLGNLQIKK